MSTVLVPAPGSPLDRVSRRFEHWRRTRQRRSPIPEALWVLAVETARTHGVNTTARTLRLNHTALTKRLKAAAGPTGGPPVPTTFVELIPPPAASPACTLALETARGAKMTIRLEGITPPDLETLSRTFWHTAP